MDGTDKQEEALVPNRAEIRTVYFQVQYLLQFYQQNLKIMTKNHSQGSCEWVDCDLEVLWVKLKQISILHSKVVCLDFVPVCDRSS